MKRKPNKLKELLIFNLLLFALAVVITINLVVTGGDRAALPEATPAEATQSPEPAATPEAAEQTAQPEQAAEAAEGTPVSFCRKNDPPAGRPPPSMGDVEPDDRGVAAAAQPALAEYASTCTAVCIGPT